MHDTWVRHVFRTLPETNLQASLQKPQLAFHMQVFGVFMHLTRAAAARVDADEETTSKAEVAVDKLIELCTAAEAVSDTDVLQLGLPVMRSVHG